MDFYKSENTNYKWFLEYPVNLEVRQVYGIVFSDEGKILLRGDGNEYKLTGGHPETSDNCFEDTLKREFLEELNVELCDVNYLGYLLVEEDNNKYAQVRMIARIKKINDIRPDLDNGKLYKRYMVNNCNVKKYLNYRDLAGNKMIDDAIEMAYKKYNFEDGCDNEFFI